VLDLPSLERFRPSELLDNPVAGRPLEVALDAIDFDPAQPRKHVDAERLEELARTIERCGVIQPVSVHPRPGLPGRYVVNVGERRVRAARLAGLVTIPAFIEGPMNAYARVIENLAREDLSPFDLATFIAERESAGETRRAIAAGLGKAPSFVTELAELANAPESVRRLHVVGRCNDVRVLYRLCKIASVNPAAIDALSEDALPLTRERVDAIAQGAVVSAPAPRSTSSPQSARRSKANAFLVEVEGRMAFLPLKPPTSMGSAQVVFEDGSREQVALGRMRLIQWTSV
jgi:ParB family chromosome partitioning protein